MKRSKRITTLIPTLALLLILPENSWALQPHGAPEGLYVHQMSHILFMAALTYLYLHIRRTTALISRGWSYLRIFCLLFILWNLIAFIGHTMALYLTPADFINRGTWHAQIAPPINLTKMVFFLSKMDHFLFVPALFFLFLSLRTFYKEAQKDQASQ